MTNLSPAKDLIRKTWPKQDFDHLALAFFNLKSGEFSSCEFHEGEEREISNFYFDLASLTKPLTMAALYIKEASLFSEDLKLLLEHRGNLPRWAILGKKSWKQTVNRFEIEESDTVYSDLSYLRLMLEVEKASGKSLSELTRDFYDSEVCFWKDCPEEALFAETGWRGGNVIQGEVNDDNCFKINQFCSHAGLFGTLRGLFKTLQRIETKYSLTKFMTSALKEDRKNRFIYGWDTVENPETTLAGTGAPMNTFGHLGFTGTSIWIDAESGKGWILLTNATKKYWFHREELNALRRKIGQILW